MVGVYALKSIISNTNFKKRICLSSEHLLLSLSPPPFVAGDGAPAPPVHTGGAAKIHPLLSSYINYIQVPQTPSHSYIGLHTVGSLCWLRPCPGKGPLLANVVFLRERRTWISQISSCRICRLQQAANFSPLPQGRESGFLQLHASGRSFALSTVQLPPPPAKYTSPRLSSPPSTGLLELRLPAPTDAPFLGFFLLESG